MSKASIFQIFILEAWLRSYFIIVLSSITPIISIFIIATRLKNSAITIVFCRHICWYVSCPYNMTNGSTCILVVSLLHLVLYMISLIKFECLMLIRTMSHPMWFLHGQLSILQWHETINFSISLARFEVLKTLAENFHHLSMVSVGQVMLRISYIPS
jgi:hypothetical protein